MKNTLNNIFNLIFLKWKIIWKSLLIKKLNNIIKKPNQRVLEKYYWRKRLR